MSSQKTLEAEIINDLSDKDILITDETDFALKPKKRNQPPKHTKVISEEVRKQRSETLKKINIQRSENSIDAKEAKVLQQEKETAEKLRILEEKKEQLKKAREAVKAKKNGQAPVPVPPAIEPKKKPSKKVKVVIEQSSSDSEDYDGSTTGEDSSDDEVVYVSKAKKPKATPKEQPITKAKSEPPVLKPNCVFKFV